MTIDAEFDGITLRKPVKEDGAPLHTLVRINPPLDMNSVYCNVLQCTHFADTCIVAEKEGQLVGYVTGYLMPTDPGIYFLWQVGVSRDGRGHGLATRMIQAILARDFCRGVRELNTTITRSNEASRHLFHTLAERENAEITEEENYFSREILGDHPAESLFRIRPLSTPKG
jgi:L-2,4-diaminobutyric acid acetyltransferase